MKMIVLFVRRHRLTRLLLRSTISCVRASEYTSLCACEYAFVYPFAFSFARLIEQSSLQPFNYSLIFEYSPLQNAFIFAPNLLVGFCTFLHSTFIQCVIVTEHEQE